MPRDEPVAGLEADRATAQLLSGVERVHHATNLTFVRRLRWLILGSLLLTIAVGIWLAPGDPAIGMPIVGGAVFSLVAMRWRLRAEFQRMITALVVRRDGLAVLYHGAIGREIPWAEVGRVQMVEDRQQGAQWEIQVRNGDPLRIRSDFDDFDELLARLRTAAQTSKSAPSGAMPRRKPGNKRA